MKREILWSGEEGSRDRLGQVRVGREGTKVRLAFDEYVVRKDGIAEMVSQMVVTLGPVAIGRFVAQLEEARDDVSVEADGDWSADRDLDAVPRSKDVSRRR